MSSHEDFHREEEVVGSSNRTFGFFFAGLCLLVAGYNLLSSNGAAYIAWTAGAAIFGFSAALAPSILAPLNRLWTKLGLLLYVVINPIVMAVLYVLTIVPIGFALRIAEKDPLRLKQPDAALESYWQERHPGDRTGSDMKNQF